MINFEARDKLFYLSTGELYSIYEQKKNIPDGKWRDKFINDMSAQAVWELIEYRIKNREAVILVCRENESGKSYALVSDMSEALEAKEFQEERGFKVGIKFMDYHKFITM